MRYPRFLSYFWDERARTHHARGSTAIRFTLTQLH
jgi:hypothetical protein